MSHAHQTVLHCLGFQLGITLWQDHWRSSMDPDPLAPTAITTTEPSAGQAQSQLGDVAAVLDQLLDRPQATMQNGIAPAATSNGIPGVNSRDLVSPMQIDATAASTAAVKQTEATDAESQQCMAIVDTIRKEEFGFGVELDPASKQLRQRQNERIGRALQRLSQELYSKDTHFVLELVQNADDNSYAEGILPALEFILQDNGVTVLNNEVCALPNMHQAHSGYSK